MSRSVMILAGGTGGHVYPGLAVADVLRAADVDLCWLGTKRGLESRVVPAHGIKFIAIPVSGLRRAGALRWLLAPLTVSFALLGAIAAILRYRPRVVLGMGGFVSGPGGMAAWLCRRPLIIHEQNAVPGLTNRLLSRIATRALAAFPGTFSQRPDAVQTGNPVRDVIANLVAPEARFANRRGFSILVFGGSRGARALNETVPPALAAAKIANLRVLHQCGDADAEGVRAAYAGAAANAHVEVTPYIEDMAAAYAAADLVIARAGALTVAEIAAVGVASILVPYPFAVDDHQTANAHYLVASNAAILLPERELNPSALAIIVSELVSDRARLLDMAKRARSLAQVNATNTVAAQCLEYVDA